MRTAMALVLCVVVAAATPLQSLALPQRAMMFSGYFGRPVPAQYYPRTYSRPGFVTRGYEPQGAMSAFAAGNTVAAGSGFYGGADGNGNGNGYSNGNGNGYSNSNGYSNGNGVAPAPDCSQCNGVVPPPGASAEQPEAEAEPQPLPLPEAAPAPAPGSQEEPGVSQEQPALSQPSAEADDSDFPNDQPATPAPVAPQASAEVPDQESGRDFSHKHHPKPASKPGRKRPTQDSSDDDEEEEDDDLPIAGLPLPGKRRKGQGNVYSSYFPMFFGGFPGARSSGGSGTDGTPGVATAIANSFSTGKGAVATSHATAYGGPHLLGSNGNRKNGSKARLASRA